MKALVVKVTVGAAEAPERCSQALNVAATAVASGVDVSLWLTGEAVWLAVPDSTRDFNLPHAASPEDLIESVLVGGKITVCTQCALRRDLTESDLRAGIRIAGVASYLEEVLAPDTQALVY